MKKNFTFTAIIKAIASSAAIAAITLITSCEREQPSGFQRNDGGVTLYATLEQPADTKTALQADGSVLWEPSEEIAVFSGSKSAKYTSTNDGPAAEAHFTPEDKSFTLGNDVWALYPYDEEATFADGVITTTIPADQTACEGTFARGANVTVAHSTTADLKFYNVCGGVRFSVTEEGINKVIFEGLDGEVIAGKVQIALDESGLPYVKDVLDGRLFITLTPPSGSTFEPGRWYYLSALPGALENGFKLRFYKDETYAKFVSDKSVTVKRSVFGSLASADAAAAYESIVTHFPETEEEIHISYELGNSIDSQISHFLGEEIKDLENIVVEINKIEGVAESHLNKNESALILTQSDGVIVNYLLNTEQVEMPPSTKAYESSPKLMSTSNGISCPNIKKALFMDAFFGKDFSNLIEHFESIGYSADYFANEVADISKFQGSFLSDYGVIYLCSHGNNDLDSANGKYKGYTVMATGTRYIETVYYDILLNDAFIAWIDGKRYYGFGEPQLGNYRFDDSIVILDGCYTATNQNGTGSLVQAFVDRGASAVLGFGETVISKVSYVSLCTFLDYMLKGASVDDAKRSVLAELNEDFDPDAYFINEKGARMTYGEVSDFLHKYWSIRQPGKNPYFLLDPYPVNLNQEVDGTTVTLSWSQCANTGDYSFDIYIDDVKIGSTTEHSVRVQAHSAKESHCGVSCGK